jgi:molybdate transport system regulatory protein
LISIDGDSKTKNKLPVFNLGCKIWLERDGFSIGDGLFILLSGVDRLGSIARAATDLGMSYRAAWGKIKEAERRWNVILVQTQIGGESGGGTVLTAEGVELMAKFKRFKQLADNAVKELFDESFK